MPLMSGLRIVLLKVSIQEAATDPASLGMSVAAAGYAAIFKGKLPGSTRSHDGTVVVV